MWEVVRKALDKYLKETSGISVVHSYPRVRDDKHLTRWKELITSKSESRINAWTISRVSMAASFSSNRHTTVVHKARLTGFLEHNDDKASQNEFDTIVDNVLIQFIRRFNLDGAVEVQGPAQLLEEGLDTIAATFVHRAEIEIDCQQRIHVERDGTWQLLMGSSQF